MAIEHASLTGADLHEPKGAASAADGQVYRATGAGSGAWKMSFGYGEMLISAFTTATTFSASSTFQKLTAGFSTNTGLVSGMTFATDTLTVVTPGIWKVEFAGVASGSGGTNTTSTYAFDVAKNGTAIGRGVALDLFGTQKTPFTSFGLATFTTSDTVTFQLRNNSNTNSCTVSDLKLVCTLVKAS